MIASVSKSYKNIELAFSLHYIPVILQSYYKERFRYEIDCPEVKK